MRYHHDQRQGHPGQQQQQQQQEPHVSHLNNPPGPPHPANKALLATLMLAAALVGFAAGAWTGGAGAHAAAGCSTGGKYELVARHGFKGHQQHQQGHQRRQAVAAAGPGAGEQHVLGQGQRQGQGGGQGRRGQQGREEAEAAALAVLDIPQPTTFEPVFPENRAASLARAKAAATAAATATAAEVAAGVGAGVGAGAAADSAGPAAAVAGRVGSSANGGAGGAAVVLLRDEVAYLRRKVRSLRSAYGAAYCDLHGIGPSGGFCLQPPAPAATAAAAAGATAAAATAAAATAGLVTGTLLDRPLCDAIARLVAGAHVADFGAGRGQYGTCLVSSPAANANNGYNASSAAASAVTAVGGSVGAVSYTAYDGGEGVEAVTGGAVRFLDLAEPTWLGVGYDWVVSLEVGEHIPPHLEAAFLGNLIRHARRGLVLSWAVPGQGGHHHVNERPNDYILARVAELGGGALRHNATAAAQLRAASSLAWFRNTLLVFDRV